MFARGRCICSGALYGAIFGFEFTALNVADEFAVFNFGIRCRGKRLAPVKGRRYKRSLPSLSRKALSS
jgi:hypothetical protein